MPDPFCTVEQELQWISARGLDRRWRRVEAVEGGRIQVEGRWRIHLAGNNYLGLAQHPKVIAAAKEALARYGAGAGSARLIAGTFPPHEELEEALARFKQAEAALLFSTGYMANLGIVTALAGPGDLVVGDRLNHASIVDACRMSRAAFRVYPHADPERLEEALRRRRGRYRRVLVITEGVFSMDGDRAPVGRIAEAAKRRDGWLLLDDAHGTGVLGPTGRGSLEEAQVAPEGILQMGTLSKALGSIGGYLAGPRKMIDLLRNRARTFLFTTALPPGCAAAALAALKVIREEPSLRRRLWENVARWTQGLRRQGWDLVSDTTPIVPVRIGSNEETMRLAQDLFEAGVYAPGIRPPTVPAGSARIRTSITAAHTADDLDTALQIFERARR